jgi:uncharacterized membrane protein
MRKLLWVVLCTFILMVAPLSTVVAQESVVRILLFYSPGCGHCANLISNDLPPIINSYMGEEVLLYIPPSPEEEAVGPPLFGAFGESIEILYVNTLTELGNGLYSSLVDMLSIPPELRAVPTMVVGDNLLIGGTEIPEKLPGIIEAGLQDGGIDWPDLQNLAASIEQLVEVPMEPLPTEEPSQEATESVTSTEAIIGDPTSVPSKETDTPQDPIEGPDSIPIFSEPDFSVLDRVKMDPVGNSIAIVVLIGMVISIAMIASRLIFPEGTGENQSMSLIIPLLSLIGIVIATYLTYVEASGAEAVCGPVGDCNTVQESKYALLFGVIPVGAIGLVGYAAIILGWLAAKFGTEPINLWAKVSVLGMSIFGTLFSIYLTFLEPFVIGATCAWCVTSAIIITVLMWLSVKPGTEALVKVMGMEQESSSGSEY